jgi:hypothetical protein
MFCMHRPVDLFLNRLTFVLRTFIFNEVAHFPFPCLRTLLMTVCEKIVMLQLLLLLLLVVVVVVVAAATAVEILGTCIGAVG